MKTKLELILEAYCSLVGAEQNQMARKAERNKEFKPLFAAIVMLHWYPSLFVLENTAVPYAMCTSLSRAMHVSRQHTGKICRTARDQYRLHKDFRDKADLLSRQIEETMKNRDEG